MVCPTPPYERGSGGQPRNHLLSDVEQIFNFREAVESMASRLAARRRRPADLRELRRSIAEMSASEALPPFRRADNTVHLLIASMSGNPMLEEAIVRARSAMFGVSDLLDFKILLANSVEGHQRITGRNHCRR
jgi:DNA-binding GntR family transcriptional regulator